MPTLWYNLYVFTYKTLTMQHQYFVATSDFFIFPSSFSLPALLNAFQSNYSRIRKQHHEFSRQGMGSNLGTDFYPIVYISGPGAGVRNSNLGTKFCLLFSFLFGFFSTKLSIWLPQLLGSYSITRFVSSTLVPATYKEGTSHQFYPLLYINSLCAHLNVFQPNIAVYLFHLLKGRRDKQTMVQRNKAQSGNSSCIIKGYENTFSEVTLWELF